MPRRSFDDGYWGDPFVQDLDKDAKLLFAYLWTNKRCNSAGLYEITLKTISFETGISVNDLPKLLEQLSIKIKWVKEQNIIWVRNFLKHQPKSPFFLKAVSKCLSLYSYNGIVKEYIEYYEAKGVSIGYIEGIETVSRGYGDLTELDKDIDKDIDYKGKHQYGDLKNILLTDDEYSKLLEKFGESSFKDKVEEMSLAIGSKGYKYKSHYLAILQWDKRERKNGTHKDNTAKGKDDSSKYISGEYGKFVKH